MKRSSTLFKEYLPDLQDKDNPGAQGEDEVAEVIPYIIKTKYTKKINLINPSLLLKNIVV